MLPEQFIIKKDGDNMRRLVTKIPNDNTGNIRIGYIVADNIKINTQLSSTDTIKARVPVSTIGNNVYSYTYDNNKVMIKLLNSINTYYSSKITSSNNTLNNVSIKNIDEDTD